MAAPTILTHGTPEQIERHVTPIYNGSLAWCQLFSEPGNGSDLAGLTTTADARRRPLDHLRPEGVELAGDGVRLRDAPRPHRLRRAEARGHLVVRVQARPARRDHPPAAGDDRARAVQRGVLRRRGRRRRRPHRRARTTGGPSPTPRCSSSAAASVPAAAVAASRRRAPRRATSTCAPATSRRCAPTEDNRGVTVAELLHPRARARPHRRPDAAPEAGAPALADPDRRAERAADEGDRGARPRHPRRSPTWPRTSRRSR